MSYRDVVESTPDSLKYRQEKEFYRNNNKCRIWLGGSEKDNIDYPLRVSSVNKISDRIRRVTDYLMLDSNIGDESVSNEDVVEKAMEYNAQMVVPKDYQNDIERTHKSIKEFEEIYLDRGCRAKVVVPLQEPYLEQLKLDEEFYSRFTYFGVGGLRGSNDTENKIETVDKVREALGPYRHIHGFGMGLNKRLLDELWNNPCFLDSLDTSTFEKLGYRGKAVDEDWKQHTVEGPNGEKISVLHAMKAERAAYQANYQLTKWYDRNTSQSELGDYTDPGSESEEYVESQKDSNSGDEQVEA